ncbi:MULTISPECIES: carboxylesterase/lipase family protein [Paenibacillus]|uniref:carboxylesterase/lipase family protein n=1 Tax=Paenibacillus TaxID=44249 RepID=UPI00073E647D|nr:MULTISPECIES: carboxylesterase family protein [Paenibacillus]MDU4696463.1 carboxylesterase family protein [Paenibacillus sp.]
MIVQTLSGKVEGVKLDGAYVFRGIPYAAPTGGSRRFKPPASPLPWQGVRRCDRYGHIAPQNPAQEGLLSELTQSEDCLVLNVWTPQDLGDELKPVMVYIHGGGFVGGTGADCEGTKYASEEGMVYVSINYRLGALGFLELSELLGEEYAASGNNGMLDIVTALQWVQHNIAAFGGDPSSVTVIGNSAGAKCVASLYVMPKAHGLFHRAIAQSGATQAIRDRQTASVTTRRLLEQLKISPSEAHHLLELPAEKLIEAQAAIGFDTSRGLHMFGPVADGLVIPFDPLESLKGNEGLPPLLIGSNEEEAAIFIHNDPLLRSPDRGALERLLGSNAEVAWEAYQHYQTSMPTEVAWNRTLTEHLYTIGAMQFAEAIALSGAPVWMYRLRCAGRLGAIHGFEGSLIQTALAAGDPGSIPTLPSDDPYLVTAEMNELAHGMRAAWCAFIRNGDPNTGLLPAWPVYGKDHATLVLDLVSSVHKDLPTPAGIRVPHQVWRMP